MITRRLPASTVNVESPQVKVEAPKVDVYPQINVAPAQLHLQTIPAPKVEFSHKPCSWVFEVTERNEDGSIAKMTATPQ